MPRGHGFREAFPDLTVPDKPKPRRHQCLFIPVIVHPQPPPLTPSARGPRLSWAVRLTEALRTIVMKAWTNEQPSRLTGRKGEWYASKENHVCRG